MDGAVNIADAMTYEQRLRIAENPDGYCDVFAVLEAAQQLVALRATRGHSGEDARAWAIALTKIEEAFMWAQRATEDKR
jgi:hypothetical protein